MRVRFDDGHEITISPGDVLNLGPGHDAWTVGEEPCILLDTGVAAYAKPAPHAENPLAPAHSSAATWPSKPADHGAVEA